MNIYVRKVASEGINHHVEHCIFVPASRVLFSSRCPIFRVSLLSSGWAQTGTDIGTGYCNLPEGRWPLSALKLSHPQVTPIRDRMAAPLRLASWIRFETVMNQQDWRTAIERLVPQIHLPDPELLALLRSCVPENRRSHPWQKHKHCSCATFE